jgi:hypothetical protein
MRILFDQGTPVPLRQYLEGHTVETVFELGWSTLKNGELLAAAEESFDLLITTDQQLRFQQNLSDRNLSVLVLMTTSWLRIKARAIQILETINQMKTGDYHEITFR